MFFYQVLIIWLIILPFFKPFFNYFNNYYHNYFNYFLHFSFFRDNSRLLPYSFFTFVDVIAKIVFSTNFNITLKTCLQAVMDSLVLT